MNYDNIADKIEELIAIGTNSTATASLTIRDGIQLGFGLTSATIASTNELVLRQDGDTFGPSILRLRNRNGENGAIYETTDPSITLVDFIFKSAINQRNIRFESRTASTYLGISPEFQFGQPANPSLIINDREVLVRASTFSISNPTKTFEYSFVSSAIAADRVITLPLLTTSDTLVTGSFSQTLTNKTLLSSGGNVIDATKLYGFTLSSTTPSINDKLSWDGSSWTPTTSNTVTQLANTASQAMGAAYAVLTGMTSSRPSGTYVVNFSGYFVLTTDSQAAITMYIDNTEVGGVNGHTYREFGTIASNGSDSWKGSVHTQAFVTLSGTQSINIRGKNITSTGNTFTNGSMIIMKIT